MAGFNDLVQGGGVAGTSVIDDNTDNAVLFQDDAGITMVEIDTTNGSGYVAISADTDASNGKPYLKLVESGNYSELTANGYAKFKAEANTAETHGSDIREMISTTSSSWRIRLANESDFDLLVVDGDASNFTYTFQTADSGVFKVVDNAGSPATYLSLAEGGSCQIGHSGGSTAIYGSAVNLYGTSSTNLRVSGQSVIGAAANGSAKYLQINGSNSTNAIKLWGTKTGHSSNTSVGNVVLVANARYMLEATQNITAATKANPCVVTVTGHGLSSGDSVFINSVGGMTQLNGNTYVITRVSSDTFSLNSTDSSGYGTYTSGGTIGPTGAVTSDASFYLQSGLPTDPANIITNHVTIHNQNATHNYTFKFPVRSGYGTVRTADSSALALTNGTGVVLAPGEYYVFKIDSFFIGGTGNDDAVHEISLHDTNALAFLTSSLTGTFTATNGDATLSSGSSTSFLTEVEPGSAIEIFESDGTSRGVYTVSHITSSTELELDSTVSGLSSSPKTGMTGKTDPTLLNIVTGDNQTALKIPKPGRLEVLQASSLKYTNLIIGDSTTGEDITNGFRNLFIGAGAGKEVTNNAGVICIGHAAGSYGTTADGAIAIGYENRGSAGGKTVIIGRDAGSESGGEKSVAIGFQAGREQGSDSHYFGTNCVMIGAHSKPAADNNSNSIAIGYNAVGHGANTAVIGDANITSIAPGSNKTCSLGTATNALGEVFCDQVLVNHTVEDDCWTGARDLVVGSKTNNTAGIYIKSASSTYSCSIAMADGVGTAAQSVGGLLQYIHNGDFWRWYAKYDGSGEYQLRMNEYGVQKHRNSLAQDSTARDSDTNTSRPAYLADTNATLILDYEFGTVAEVTLAANVTAIKIFNAPAHGSSQTMTVRIKQHSTAVTLSYSSVTIYSDSGSTSKAGQLLWAGGVSHTLTATDNAIDIVQFTCMPNGDTDRDVYGCVIGQAFA